jgi:hypothetical protein
MPRSNSQRTVAALILLMALCLGSVAAEDGTKPSAEAEYNALREAWRKTVEDLQKREQAATTDAEREKLHAEHHTNVGKFATQLVAFAEKHPKTPEAAKGLAWIIRVGRGPATADLEKAMVILARDHGASAVLTAEPIILGRLSYNPSPRAEALIIAIRDNNPDKAGQASASLALGRYYRETKQSQKAEVAFEAVIAKHPDTHAARKAKGALTDLRGNLAVGKTAPEIEGEDIDGKRFKLSDYRGKVVVLDFWGHW